jgi:hypothetical protein
VSVSSVIYIDLYIIFTSSSGRRFISETNEEQDHLRMPKKEENHFLSRLNLNVMEKKFVKCKFGVQCFMAQKI